ncbi:MAG: xanthine dehydrogenase family protein molybdopterin-binding subunit [Deltaproteobacteria bacterium]|nr:xanthine dehydrogenase family protein molybdopterin-binding subunit [Deltaproteobacteria bacterium]
MKGDIGKPFDRIDARAKVTGTATYTSEIGVANAAHAVIVGSPIARGRILGIETAAAQQQAGVLAVLTPANAPQLPGAAPDPKKGERVLNVLQDDRVWYVDQPIAVVIADTLERAQHAAALVAVKHEAAPVDAALDASIGRAIDAGDLGPNGKASSARGDVASAMATATHRLEQVYRTQIQAHNPIEPHATTAVWHGDNRLTIYDATQGIFNVRDVLAKRFGLEPKNVRVISHYLGGGFGCKGSPWSHVVLAAMAARAVKRPVKLVLTRPQMFALVGYRPTTIQRITLGADARGKLVALSHDTTAECSRFDRFVEPSGLQSRHLYSCPNVTTSHRIVELDVGTPTFTRGPGATSGTFALESAMDELAYAANVDPVELRLRNHATRDEDEDKPYSAKTILQCYAQAAQRFGWSKRPMKPGSLRDGGKLVGWGMASVTYPAKQRPAAATARMLADGTLVVQSGTQDIGTGTYTIMSQIAADALDVPLERVRFELGDTALPEAPLSAGSMTAASVGVAVAGACAKLRAELAPQRRAPDEPWAAVVARSGKPEILATYAAVDSPERAKYSCHSFGACFVEVRIDPLLPLVEIGRIVAAYAAGTIVNPKTTRSQYIGGLVWGIGYALREVSVRDPRSARIVTRDLSDYHVPVETDVPDLEVIQVDEVDRHVNELGIKGVGEIGMSGVTAAIANAVFHATGKRIRELPITIDKLL